MFQEVTAEQVKTAAIAAGKTFIENHRCGGCNSVVGWILVTMPNGDRDPFYDSNCGCVKYETRPTYAGWQDCADFVNIQTNLEARNNVRERCGLPPEPEPVQEVKD